MDWCAAIEARRLVSFVYQGHKRLVVPAAYGLHATTGNVVLRGYQTGGTSSSRVPPFWTLFRVDEIVSPQLSEQTFDQVPPEYRRDDEHIGTIYCQL